MQSGIVAFRLIYSRTSMSLYMIPEALIYQEVPQMTT